MVDDGIQRIIDFIKKIEDGDLEYTANAMAAQYAIAKDTILGTLSKDKSRLGDELSLALSKFRSSKDSNVILGFEFIDECLLWINRAYATKSVKPSEGIFRKYRDATQEIA